LFCFSKVSIALNAFTGTSLPYRCSGVPECIPLFLHYEESQNSGHVAFEHCDHNMGIPSGVFTLGKQPQLKPTNNV